jgi:transposase
LAAAAWGEPVPKDASDAAELAAKGRRMLERYGKSKKKSAIQDEDVQEKGIYESPEVASNTTVGRVAELAKALSARFSAPVKVRSADRDMVIFDINNGGNSVTMRVTYYFDGEEFMFGEPHQVRAETVYLPVDSPTGAVPGHAFNHDMDEDDEHSHQHGGMLRSVGKKPGGDCGCGCDSESSCGVPQKPITWGSFKERNPGTHLFIRAIGKEKTEAFEMVKSVCDYHDMDIKELEDGVAVPFIDSASDEGYDAVLTIASNMSDSFDAKSARGKMRRLGGVVGNRMDTFDPNAIDGDNDGTVQEGTRFRRPAGPQNMPKVKPIQVPRREDVPLKPSVPSTPTPAPTKVPEKPRVPQRAGRLSGAVGSRDNEFDFSDFSIPEDSMRVRPIDGNLGGRRPGQTPTGYENVLRDMISVDEETFNRLTQKPSQSRTRLSGNMAAGEKNPKRTAQIIEMWESGRTVPEIANEIGSSIGNVQQLINRLQKEGRTSNRSSENPNNQTVALKKSKERAAKLWNQGFTVEEIASRMGVSKTRASQLVASQRKAGKTRAGDSNFERNANIKPRSGNLSGNMAAKKKKEPNLLSPDLIDDLYEMDPDDAWTIDFPEDMFDELNIGEAESLLYDMRERWRKFANAINGNWNDELADRLTNEDEDSIVKYLMKWEDLSKAKAKKEAEKLQEMWDKATAVENVHGSVVNRLKKYIAELEKDELD